MLGDGRRRGAVRNPIHDAGRRARSSRQVIQTPVVCHLQIDGRRNPRGECRHAVACGWIEPANPSAAVVGEKIVPRIVPGKLRGQRRIKCAAGDRARAGVAVRVSRSDIPGICCRTFCLGPSVVRARYPVVDLLPRVLSDIVDEELGARGVEREGERVPKAERPDRAIPSARRGVEGIVGRNRTVAIDSEHLAEQVGHHLRVRAVRVLSDGCVQLAIRPERQRSAVVVGGAAEVVELEDHHLASGHSGVAVGGEAADPVVYSRGRRRVINVDEVISGESRIEGDAEQPTFAR
jgi:hypothetical protein